MKKIKIAQIGTSQNSHGNDIWNTLKNLPDIFEIVGYALPENEREKFPNRMPDFEGYTEMTVDEILTNPEIEAVTVETEEIYITKYALMAANAGKHIHMEKPGSQCLEDFEKLISLYKSNGKVFHTGYMYRYNPYVMELKEAINRGELGEIISIETQMNCRHPENVRSWLGNFKGGIMFFLGCHLIDLILQLGGMPENIIPLNRSTNYEGVTAEDFGMAILEYKNGVSFAKINATEKGGFARRQLVVAGTEKTVEIKPLEKYFEGFGDMFTGKNEYSSNDWIDNGVKSNSEPFNRYNKMMSSFAEYVRGEKINPYTADYELELYKIILKCCGV